MYHHDIEARWRGRNLKKDALRDEIWGELENSQQGIGPVRSRIPNFVGADEAAFLLSRTEAWKNARIVKCNPDPPQIPVRLRALYDGKLLYTPVPELVEGFPFVLLDPKRLKEAGISFELAATSQGAVRHGQPVQFDDMEPMDFLVVGCVAATAAGGRTGKGGGFADLELGIFHDLGKLPGHAVIATTVHEMQMVPNAAIEMLSHDSPLDLIATPSRLIETGAQFNGVPGVQWQSVLDDQYRDIPFLGQLKERILAAKR